MKRNQKNIFVHEKTLSFLKGMRDQKGFSSIEELVYSCAKALEYQTRGQIISLSEIDVSKIQRAKDEDTMYDQLKEDAKQ